MNGYIQLEIMAGALESQDATPPAWVATPAPSTFIYFRGGFQFAAQVAADGVRFASSLGSWHTVVWHRGQCADMLKLLARVTAEDSEVGCVKLNNATLGYDEAVWLESVFKIAMHSTAEPR